ncbi:MAG: ankyrin repeat domain-containing protein [Mycobacteriales bacterium]
MPDLPARADLEQLRHQAKDLLKAAKNGDDAAAARIARVSTRMGLAAAQLAVARDYGFASWVRLKAEVDRREILDACDVDRLNGLLAESPELAVDEMQHWRDHPLGAAPLNYVAMLRFDTSSKLWRDVPGTGALTRALLLAGAPVDGDPGASETPLITAASYGDAEVAQVLIDAGADLDATASATAGGVPLGTALVHAAVFSMTHVVDVLIAAGARIDDIVMAAAAGDVSGWLNAASPLEDRIRALVMAADHQRVEVIDRLVVAGTPVDAEDSRWGRQALRLAAQNGRSASVRRLLAHGADPNLRDATRALTALDWCRLALAETGATPGHHMVEEILRAATAQPPPRSPSSS